MSRQSAALTQPESTLLRLVRSGGGTDFQLTIACSGKRWSVSISDHDEAGSATATGKGATFADAWRRQQPLWCRQAREAVR